MKKSLLLATALLSLVSLNLSAALPKSDYPAGATVLPAPDGTVDVSANKFPLGVSAISFSFSGSDVDKNPSNTTPAELYLNDFTKPAVTTLTTSVDMETYKTCGVIFPGSWNQNGEYKIVVPAGMFLVGGAPSAAMTLYYEINVGWYAEPVNNMVVPELEDIVLTFPDATEVKFTDKFHPTFAERLGTTVGFTSKIDGNRAIFSISQGDLSSKLDTPGQYLLHIEDGGIEYVKDGKTYYTEEIRLTYHIPSSPEPSIWPYVDEPVTDGIEYFELEAPAGFDYSSFFLINNMAVNYLYRCDENGILDTSTPECIAKAIYTESDATRGIIYLGLFDPITQDPLNFEFDKGDDSTPLQSVEWTIVPGSVKPWKPAVTGYYCLLLSQGLYSGNYTSLILGSKTDFVTSSPFRFYYEISGRDSSGVEDVAEVADNSDVTVYTLTGIRVLKNAPKENLKNLPAGLYIVNGKKSVLK